MYHGLKRARDEEAFFVMEKTSHSRSMRKTPMCFLLYDDLEAFLRCFDDAGRKKATTTKLTRRRKKIIDEKKRSLFFVFCLYFLLFYWTTHLVDLLWESDICRTDFRYISKPFIYYIPVMWSLRRLAVYQKYFIRGFVTHSWPTLSCDTPKSSTYERWLRPHSTCPCRPRKYYLDAVHITTTKIAQQHQEQQ